MIIKGVVDEVFQDYKKCSMLIEMPYCTFKCLKELNLPISICQNCELENQANVNLNINDLIDRYVNNDLTEAIIFAGLEPMDSFSDILEFIDEFRKVLNDEIVVYTGFDESEIYDKITLLSQYKNVIMKFGRFIPNQEPHYDETLGVNLASNNQYARRIS
jgi:hypothetical protein